MKKLTEHRHSSFELKDFNALLLLIMVIIIGISSMVTLILTGKKVEIQDEKIFMLEKNLVEIQGWFRENSEIAQVKIEHKRVRLIERINCLVDSLSLQLQNCELNDRTVLIQITPTSFAFPDTINNYKTNANLFVEKVKLRVGYTFSDVTTFNGQVLNGFDIVDLENLRNIITVKKSIEKNMDMYPSYLSEYYPDYPYNQSKQGFVVDIYIHVSYDVSEMLYPVLKGTNVSTERFFK